MTLLTFYTPTYRRPRGLARTKANVAAQSSHDWQHLIIPDEVGIGVVGMFRAIPEHHAEIRGEYVYFLSDDDELIDPHLVRDLCTFADDHDRPDVIMVKAQIRNWTFPTPDCWEAAPVLGCVTLANWIVKRAVWTSVPYGHRYEGDYDFISAVWASGARFAWWDRLVCTAQDWGQGRPEC